MKEKYYVAGGFCQFYSERNRFDEPILQNALWFESKEELHKSLKNNVKCKPLDFFITEITCKCEGKKEKEKKEVKYMEVDDSRYDSRFDEELAFTKKAFALINQIYFEEDKSKRVNLAWEIYNLICKKDDGTLRTYEEVTILIYNLRIKMQGQIGAYIQPDAEIYFYTKVLPILLSAMDKLEEITMKWYKAEV